MVRFARVIALNVAHHITQRGNARRFILENDQERRIPASGSDAAGNRLWLNQLHRIQPRPIGWICPHLVELDMG
jgi:hypothetical protein